MSKPRLKVFIVTRENWYRLLGAQVLLYYINQKKPSPLSVYRLCRVHGVATNTDNLRHPVTGEVTHMVCTLYAHELEMQLYPGHPSNRHTHAPIPLGTRLYVADLKPEDKE